MDTTGWLILGCALASAGIIAVDVRERVLEKRRLREELKRDLAGSRSGRK